MTNAERRVSYLPRLIDPPGEALPDVEILCRFARKMGWGAAFDYADEGAIFDEHCALTRGTPINMSGMSHARLQREGSLQWPCPAPDHPGTPRLFQDHQFLTADGRAVLHGVRPTDLSEPLTHEYPLVLTTGRIRDQWHTMTRTGKVARLRQHVDTPYVEIHPEDAAALRVHTGDTITVYNDRGAVQARAALSETIKPGVLFLPMHWSKSLQHGDARANLLTSSVVDPRSKEPDFKYAAVAVSKVSALPGRVIVAGGGTAALAFVQAYRKRNQQDEIIVFGRESCGFYNRILLPDLIGGECGWGTMQTASETALRDAGIVFRAGTRITAIDRDGHFVRDEHGELHPYDKLVLATGSEPVRPPECPRGMGGVFTLRTRQDADAIMAHAGAGTRCVVVGGGLLGLELVAALQQAGCACRLVHRSSRLMGRQLDPMASQMLAGEIKARGITIHLNEGIASVHGTTQVQGVRTHNGQYLPCEALFFATGTAPNIELARSAGLPCRHGVVVDDRMQTRDPDILAIGEIAEHRHRCYGTTPAAQDQAEVAAAQLAGDIWNRYTGNIAFNVLKLKGLSLCTMGQLDHNPADPGYEEILFLDRAEQVYQKCLVYRNRLIGAVLYGDISPMAAMREWIESGLELDDARRQLLRGGAAARETVEGRLVCSCNQVGEGNLRHAIADGCDSVDALCARTGAGTGCGSCKPELATLLDHNQALAGAAR
jgi:ferredoxin-nitrate reductase